MSQSRLAPLDPISRHPEILPGLPFFSIFSLLLPFIFLDDTAPGG